MSNYITKLEFEVKDLEQRNADQIRDSLIKRQGIHNAIVNAKENKIFVETYLPSSVILNQIERESQSIAILRGMGTSAWNSEKQSTSAAVSIISNFDNSSKPIRGVVRFVQIDDKNCAIDGTIDGLSPGSHALNVCEFGDISRGCESTGNHFNPSNMKHGLPPSPERHAGDLGNILANKHEIATFRIVNDHLRVWDIIGRSLCVYEKADLGDGNAGRKIACGIIARSAGLFENAKKICLCSGKTLWEERDVVTANSKI